MLYKGGGSERVKDLGWPHFLRSLLVHLLKKCNDETISRRLCISPTLRLCVELISLN